MLHVVATPIGNLGDLSPRGLEAFKSATLIACEDTRRTWQLLTHFGVPRPEMISYRQGNEERTTERIVEAVQAGAEVVLCSDGGYPGISDPARSGTGSPKTRTGNTRSSATSPRSASAPRWRPPTRCWATARPPCASN